MSNRIGCERIRKPRALVVASLLTMTAIAVTQSSLGAATATAQTCAAPILVDQSGRQFITPGINALANVQKVTSKVNLFQCSAKSTGRSGILLTTLKTAELDCTAFTTPHVWNFSATIKWVNGKSSTGKLAYATSGTSRLANITGNITAGVFAGRAVAMQLKWRPVISPHGKKLPDACANKIASHEKGRASVIGELLFTTKPFTVA